MALLEVKNLKKYFPTPRGILHAVDGVSFTLEAGHTLGIVGESGCGKSTLGKVILRLEDPTAGSVFFDGKEVSSLPPKEFKACRRDMQMIFQDPYASLDPRMSVQQIIAEPFDIYPELCPADQRKRRVEELMDTVGLAQRFAASYPHELDGGRRQRIGIARALAMNPRFIVCDEPVSALDVSIQAQILNLLQDLQRDHGIAYMFITHDLSVVKHISHDICVMYLGQAVEKCETHGLFAAPLHPYTQALLSAIPVPSIHNRRERIILKGELSSPINPKPGCRFASRCIYATEECFNRSPELKEVTPRHFVACHNVGHLVETAKD